MSELNIEQEKIDEQLGKKAEKVMSDIDFDFFEEPPWLKHARTCLKLNCESAGDFVNTMLKSCNLKENPNKTFPISFASYGKSCDFRPGGILVFDEHVGIIDSIEGDTIKLISCYNKKIQITNASQHGEILTCRRPDNFVL